MTSDIIKREQGKRRRPKKKAYVNDGRAPDTVDEMYDPLYDERKYCVLEDLIQTLVSLTVMNLLLWTKQTFGFTRKHLVK
jgi:hypothetical protein